MVQIYCGNGKGKTTAAVGAAVRGCGAGFSVLFVQFLKDGSSSELHILRDLKEVTVLVPEEFYGFSSQLGEEEKKALTACYKEVFNRIDGWIADNSADGELKGIIVLDELLHAVNAGLVEEAQVTELLDAYSSEYEFIITGYYPTSALVKRADYISNITAEKHPYALGVKARKGIEL